LQARADLRWRVSPKDAEEMARTQRAILASAAQALRPGGVLVYSTCTISPIENEHLIESFLDSHADFSLDDLASELPAFARGQPRVALPGTVVTLPHLDDTAGFFIARMRRS
jgi:16S rRNA (cytosine967-C5)-methyltransferase